MTPKTEVDYNSGIQEATQESVKSLMEQGGHFSNVELGVDTGLSVRVE